MRSIIYVSVADPLITPDDIADILGTARRNNARDALTGALIFNGHNFMPVDEQMMANFIALGRRRPTAAVPA